MIKKLMLGLAVIAMCNGCVTSGMYVMYRNGKVRDHNFDVQKQSDDQVWKAKLSAARGEAMVAVTFDATAFLAKNSKDLGVAAVYKDDDSRGWMYFWNAVDAGLIALGVEANRSSSSSVAGSSQFNVDGSREFDPAGSKSISVDSGGSSIVVQNFGSGPVNLNITP